MHEEPLTLEHQGMLEERFRHMDVPLSEYSFANLYLFRQEHAYTLLFSKDLYIKGKTRDGLLYIMPTSPLEKLDFGDMDECLKSVDFLFPIPEEWAAAFNSEQYAITHLDRDSDYCYSIEKMRTYPGRHLSGRRNLVKQFLENYLSHEDVALGVSKNQDALQILDEWRLHAPAEVEFTDYAACREALEKISLLHLNGILIYAEGKPAGFLIGEPLTDEVYVVHFVKAITMYKGIYQYLYQAFAKTLQNNFKMLNLEQDLDIPELRQSKKAYLPDEIKIKYRIMPVI